MKIKLYTLIMVAAALGLGSCKKESKAVVDQSAAIAVQLSTEAKEDNQPFVTASGKIAAQHSANLSTRMMGFVDKVYVKVGDKVTKGQRLLAINNVDLQAKLAQANAGITAAEAGYKNAKKDFNRFTTLFKENSASQKELDDITAHYQMAKANLEAAQQMKKEVQAQFSYVNISAPFTGVVTNRFAEVGDMANPGMPLVAVEAPGKFEVTAMVPETEISHIEQGCEVTVVVKALDAAVKGKVTEISTSAKNTGGQYLVKVILEETEANVLSGMFATVQFPVKKKWQNDMVLIPTEVLVHKGQLSGVYTVSASNTALLRWLRLGRTYGDKVEVLSGLTAAEPYIVKAEGKLYNGVKVTVQ